MAEMQAARQKDSSLTKKRKKHSNRLREDEEGRAAALQASAIPAENEGVGLATVENDEKGDGEKQAKSEKKKKKQKRKEWHPGKKSGNRLGEEDGRKEEYGSGSEKKKQKKNKKKVSQKAAGAETAAEAEAGRQPPTVSIAVSGAVIENAQTLERATMLAGQIARAAAIFRIHEVIVYDEDPEDCSADPAVPPSSWRGERYTGSGGAFLARVLQYLDTPQYLRRLLVPMHPDLRHAGRLPPLDAPHQPRAHEWTVVREGAVVQDGEEGSVVEVGLEKTVRVRQRMAVGTRVTVAMGASKEMAFAQGAVLDAVPRQLGPGPVVPSSLLGDVSKGGNGGGAEGGSKTSAAANGEAKALGGRQASDSQAGVQADTRAQSASLRPERPRGVRQSQHFVSEEAAEASPSSSLYWGFHVRLGRGLASVLRDSPFVQEALSRRLEWTKNGKENGGDARCGDGSGGGGGAAAAGDGGRWGYDLIIGTSERGLYTPPSQLRLPPFRHALVVFGGPQGLEESMRQDRSNLQAMGGAGPQTLFDQYINTCPGQGSRTIRTEEAILISLTHLSEALGKFRCD